MKALKIILYLCCTALLIDTSYAQVQYPRTISSNSITLSGRGDFSDVRDQGKIYRFVESNTADFKMRAYIKSFNYYNINSKAGILIRDASLAQQNDGTKANYGLFCEKNRIILQGRLAGGTATQLLKEAAIIFPCWLELEKQGTTLYARYSSDAETAVPVFTELTSVPNAFTLFTNYTKALAVASSTNLLFSSAVFSNYLSVSNTTPNCTQTPTILSLTKNSTGNSYTVNYATGTGITGFNWKVLDGSVTITSGTVTTLSTSASFTVDLGSTQLTSKSYTLSISAKNCIGSATKTFTSSVCNIANNTKLGVKAFGVPTAVNYDIYAKIFNNKLWLVQILGSNPELFAVRGVNFIGATFTNSWGSNDYTCFEGQNTGFGGLVEPTGFVTPTGYTLTTTADGAKIYKFGTVSSGVDPPTITSTPSAPIAETSVSIAATNCTGTITFFKNNTSLTPSTNPLIISSPVANDIYTAKCTVSGIISASSGTIVISAKPIYTGTGDVNTVPDITIAPETYWNRFQPDLIDDFSVSESIDKKTGQMLPNKWFIWHAPYRNLFSSGSEVQQIAKMLKKGVTAFNISKLPTYTEELAAIVPASKLVTETYGLGSGSHPEEANLDAFETWAKGGVSSASGYGAPFTNGKYDVLATISDYEGQNSHLSTRLSSHYYTVGLNAMANISKGRVGFQYGSTITSQNYYTSNLYNGSNNQWETIADNTVPTAYQGLSSASNNRIMSILEVSLAYETLLPEDTPVQDQNNIDWFRIKHFGRELSNTFNDGNLSGTNAQHWAANIGTGAEAIYRVSKTYPNGGQDFLLQLKPSNETDNGFHYDERYWSDRGYKRANYVSRYGIVNEEDEYIDGVKTGRKKEVIQPAGSEYIPNFIAEGQVALAYFSGAKGINWWSSDFTDVAIPKIKTGNSRRGARYDNVNWGNRDLECYTYTLKALWRLAQKVNLSNGDQYSFFDIADGTEIYSNESTKVIYPTINTNTNGIITTTTNTNKTISQIRALDWQILKHTPVRAVVNVRKKVVFVLAFQAYGVEDDLVTFIYNENGADINETFRVPIGKIVIKAFPFTNTKVSDGGGSVAAPTITSSPSNPTAGNSVTFTASACTGGRIDWFNGGDTPVSIINPYPVLNPGANNNYTATCTIGTKTSVASNIIKISGTPTSEGVKITPPVKPNYYYSDSHPPSYYYDANNSPSYINNSHPPVIYPTTTRDNVSLAGKSVSTNISMTARYLEEDFVWLENNEIKIGLNLRRGGQLAWASRAGSTENLVYNGYDGGFQVTMDAYTGKDGYVQGGQTSSSGFPGDLTNYNTTMGGDKYNNSQSLIDYHSVTNGFYVKLRPILYTIGAEFSQAFIEATYVLVGSAVKITYKYSSYRNDPHISEFGGINGTDAPACFIINTLNKYQTYVGSSPWTLGSVIDTVLPNTSSPPQRNAGNAASVDATERWALLYRYPDLKSIAIYIPSDGNSQLYTLKQKEVYDANDPGGEFQGGFSYFGGFTNFSVLAFDVRNYTKTIETYIILETSPEKAREKIYLLSGHQIP